MNALHIRIPDELFKPARNAHFEGEMVLPVMEVGPDTYRFAHPLIWQIDITNVGDALLVRGVVTGDAEGVCARCLEACTLSCTGQIEGYYLLDDSCAPLTDMDEDEFDILPPDNVIDIQPLIKAALLLEFPLVPLCSKTCKGLCPVCGANLNEGACDCALSLDADDTMQKNPFSSLKDFPFDNI